MEETELPQITNWTNRIKRYAEVDPAELIANPKNFRLHPADQAAALAKSIEQTGFISPVIVQESSGIVIDGHLRLSLAIANNVPAISVGYADVTEEEADTALAVFDAITAMAEIDNARFAALAASLPSTEEANALLRSISVGVGMRIVNDRTPPEEFAAFDDETIETEHTCPKCGYRYSGGS